MRKEFDLEDCMVEVKNLKNGKKSVVVYYVTKGNVGIDKQDICRKMTAFTRSMGLIVDGYREFYDAFPISPTTLKPKTRYTDGFFNYSNSGELITINYLPSEDIDTWTIKRQNAS